MLHLVQELQEEGKFGLAVNMLWFLLGERQSPDSHQKGNRCSVIAIYMHPIHKMLLLDEDMWCL